MPDAIQHAIQTLAAQNTLTRESAIFCGTTLVVLLSAAWLLVVLWCRLRLTCATVGRVVVLVVLAYLSATALTHIVMDPRPYLVTHTPPLTPTAHDNGFPSDHVLLASALTASLWWINRRLVLAFAGGTLLVLLGRLGIGAHHTLDVLGSVAIVAVAALVARVLPLPATWQRPLLPLMARRDRVA